MTKDWCNKGSTWDNTLVAMEGMKKPSKKQKFDRIDAGRRHQHTFCSGAHEDTPQLGGPVGPLPPVFSKIFLSLEDRNFWW
jgi:hypothetical protein